MISIELNSGTGTRTAESLGSEDIETLSRILNQCDQESIREVEFRLPERFSATFGQALGTVLKRSFRFTAYFRGLPPKGLAELFLSAGHRITVAASVEAFHGGLEHLRECPALAAGAPWQVNLFLALSQPPRDAITMLEGLSPRSGITLTLGLGWAGIDTGPSSEAVAAEQDAWTAFLLATAAWLTQRGVTLRLGCGLPLCLFSTEQLGELALTKLRFPLATCRPGLVLTLDGRARACPRLPTEGWVALPAGATGLRELTEQLTAGAGVFAAFCGRPAEEGCRSFATGACGGGCMAHNAGAWSGGGRGEAGAETAAGRLAGA